MASVSSYLLTSIYQGNIIKYNHTHTSVCAVTNVMLMLAILSLGLHVLVVRADSNCEQVHKRAEINGGKNIVRRKVYDTAVSTVVPLDICAYSTLLQMLLASRKSPYY